MSLSAEPIIYTIGHSTRTLEEFLQILRSFDIEKLIDIRAFPSSKRYPHFGKEMLCRELSGAGIGYLWLGNLLGGYRRKGIKNSPNIAIKSTGFRNYADYMFSHEFKGSINFLLKEARLKKVAIMCAERLYFRCHRWLISDYLLFKGAKVLHIIEERRFSVHKLHPSARMEDDRLVYDLVR
jgi:uncharacterized protein (DUF488 family)